MKYSGFVFFLFFIFSKSAIAAWTAHADFTSCPRKYFPNTSGQEGPFATIADCEARVARAKREMQVTCAVYTCKETAGLNSNNASSSSAQQQMDKHIGDALSAGMSGQISGAEAVGLMGLGIIGKGLIGASEQNNRPLTPEEQAARAEAQRQAQEQARQRAEREQMAEAAYQMNQDTRSLAFLDAVASAIATPTSSKPENTDFKPKILCKGGEPGLHTCHVIVCGGAYNGDPVCCPEGYPKLNECDCNCYRANADFECKRYAACQYSHKTANINGGGK